jgi:hypothetical protein
VLSELDGRTNISSSVESNTGKWMLHNPRVKGNTLQRTAYTISLTMYMRRNDDSSADGHIGSWVMSAIGFVTGSDLICIFQANNKFQASDKF